VGPVRPDPPPLLGATARHPATLS